MFEREKGSPPSVSAARRDPDKTQRSAGGAVQRAVAGDTRSETKGCKCWLPSESPKMALCSVASLISTSKWVWCLRFCIGAFWGCWMSVSLFLQLQGAVEADFQEKFHCLPGEIQEFLQERRPEVRGNSKSRPNTPHETLSEEDWGAGNSVRMSRQMMFQD